MLLSSLLFGTLLLGGGDGIVINEFSYDDSSTDDREFVELYNPTGKDVDISGWVLEATDPATPDNNADYTIPANTTLKAGDYYVLGSAMVPNVDQVVGATNLWENSQESITLRDKDKNVVDTVVYEGNKGWPAAKLAEYQEGEGLWGNHFSADGSETSMSRMRDGHDTDNNRDFVLRPSTPGTTNNLTKGSYIDLLDGMVGSDVAAFGASFVKPKLIDPGTADTNNPNVIPVSPQGKQAAIMWDPAGGGNAAMLLRDPSCNVVVEAWVYFDAKLEAMGEKEVWSLGVQGTTGTFFNFPDPSGSEGHHANGNTGVSWTFEVTDSAATLYLVDHNDGGRTQGTLPAPKTDRTVIGTPIKLLPADTGWHRLRLEVSGDTVTGFFKGTYGGTDGTKVTGKLAAPAEGDVYIGYREALNDNSTTRPFTFDRLTVLLAANNGAVDNFGTVKATSAATPRAGTNGCPVIGNSKFQITGGGLVAGPNASLTMVGLPQTPPIDLNAALGGQKCSFLYVFPVLFIFVGNADANGDLAIPIPIANDTGLKGAKLSAQILDFDATLSETFKFGNSDGMTFTIGG